MFGRAFACRIGCLALVGWNIPQGSHQSVAQEAEPAASESPFEQWDGDRDGFLTPDEFPSRFPKSLFQLIDVDDDGKVSRAEDDQFRARRRSRNGKQRSERAESRSGQPGATGRDSHLPPGTTIERDLIYGKVGDRELRLDLFRPKASTATPLVVWVHGGGWKSGSKNGTPALPLLDRGFAVASVEYRLSGEARFPAAIEDCKAAVSFLRLHAKRFNLDPERFGAWGSSAGGHLVAMLGTTGEDDFNTHPVTREASSRVQAVCNWFGPSDFLRMNDFPGKIDHDAPGSPESLFIGGPIQQNRDKVARANPMTYATADDPPFLHLHGESDQMVPFNQSELLHAALTSAGVESALHRVAKGDHGFRGAEEPREALVKRSMDFFDQTLKAK